MCPQQRWAFCRWPQSHCGRGCRDPAALVNGARDRQLCVSLTGRVCTGRLAVSGGVLDEIMFESVATVRKTAPPTRVWASSVPRRPEQNGREPALRLPVLSGDTSPPALALRLDSPPARLGPRQPSTGARTHNLAPWDSQALQGACHFCFSIEPAGTSPSSLRG